MQKEGDAGAAERQRETESSVGKKVYRSPEAGQEMLFPLVSDDAIMYDKVRTSQETPIVNSSPSWIGKSRKT